MSGVQKSGAEIVIEVLREQGVDTVFGCPGSAVLELYDALYHSPDIRHILTAHEQAAAHAADGCARAGGKPGVVIATSGPGATNLVTGIAAAQLDSSPVVAITGNVATHLLGSDAFQEVDIAGITMPITKYSFIACEPQTLARDLREAFTIATRARKGAVLLDLPMDIAAARTAYTPETPEKAAQADLPDLTAAVQVLRTAERPLLYAGGGAQDAAESLLRLAEQCGIPVVCSLMGLGAFPGKHPLYAGMLGEHGEARANRLLRDCDVLLAVGTRFSNRVTQRFALRGKCLIHLDADAAELDKNLAADIALQGDAAALLTELLRQLPEARREAWVSQVEGQPQEMSAPAQILRALRELCDEDTILVTDVGQHQIWAARHFAVNHPRSFLTSGGLGAMGFGMGAAIGAKLACPEKQVVLVTGDGSFHMNCAELATMQKYGLAIPVLVMNNGALGMVREWQKRDYGKRFSQSEPRRVTDFCRLAEAFGVKGMRLAAPEQAREVLREALQSACAAVVDCIIPKEIGI